MIDIYALSKLKAIVYIYTEGRFMMDLVRKFDLFSMFCILLCKEFSV